MKRFLAVLLVTLGSVFFLNAQDHSQVSTRATQNAAPKKTPSKSTRRRTGRRAVRRRTPQPAVVVKKPSEAPWSKFTSEDGQFSVLLPGQPTDQTETVESEHGPYTTHLMVVRDAKNVFLVGWVDYQPSFNFNRQAELEMNRDNFIKGVNAKLLDSHAVVVDGYRVIEFTAENDEKIYKSRVYIVGRRPYQIVVGSPKGEDDSVNINRFLNSFKVTLN